MVSAQSLLAPGRRRTRGMAGQRSRAWSALSRVAPGLKLAAAERRRFDRTEAAGTTIARRVDHAVVARRLPFLKLDLRDVSAGGLAAVSTVKVNCGETLSVTLPQSGTTVVGHVVRCEPGETGWNIGLTFDGPAAA